MVGLTPKASAAAGPDVAQQQAQHKLVTQSQDGMLLRDPTLSVLAIGLDDVETVRIAQENRLRILMAGAIEDDGTVKADKDGKIRGVALAADDPIVILLMGQLEALKQIEEISTKALQKQLRHHLLYPWIKAQVGLGDKQTARLLHAIGDPYWNDLHDRPRTVSELWSYCGLAPEHHNLPAGQSCVDAHGTGASGAKPAADHSPSVTPGCAVGGSNDNDTGQNDLGTQADHAGVATNLPAGLTTHDTQRRFASGIKPAADRSSLDTHQGVVGGSNDSDTGHLDLDAHGTRAGVARRRKRGEKANWSTEAKTRTYLIAEACMKQLRKPCVRDEGAQFAVHVEGCACSPYRLTYDYAREKYADSVHLIACARCGPKGKPAQPESPLSDGHKHMRAMRLVMKGDRTHAGILIGLWRESKRLYEQQPGKETK